MKLNPVPPSKFVLKGIELHLDVLSGYMMDGKIAATAEEIAVIKSLIDRVGGGAHAFDSFGHAISYDKLTRQMMSDLGVFYCGLHDTGAAVFPAQRGEDA